MSCGTVLRARADIEYVLAVASDECRNRGWVEMRKCDRVPKATCQWEFRNGVLRSKANPKYALCVTQDGCKNGGWVHLWEQGEEADIYGQWIIQGNSIRAKANPGYMLCVRHDGFDNDGGGGLHMWAFDKEPDLYGQWYIEHFFAKPSVDSVSDTPSRRSTGNEEGLLHGVFPLDCMEPTVYLSEASDSEQGLGLLGHVNEHLRSASVVSPKGETTDLRKEHFIHGLELLVQTLDTISWNLGRCLLGSDTKKLRRSKARQDEQGYRAWLLSEISFHSSNQFVEYVDDSATMANLWISRTLEFLMNLFKMLCDGKETAHCISVSYTKCCSKHHNFFERQAFLAVVNQLPCRKDLLRALAGHSSGTWEDVLREAAEFADICQHIVKFCRQMDEQLSSCLKANRALLSFAVSL